MLKRSNVIFISVALFIAGLFYLYYKYVYKEPVYWYKTFRDDRKDPYGTFILYNLIEEFAGSEGIKKVNNPLSQFLERESGKDHQNYFFVNENLYLDSADAASLFAFAEKGNDVFISANSFPYELNRKLFKPDTVPYYDDYVEAAEVDTTVQDSLNNEPSNLEETSDSPVDAPGSNSDLETLAIDTASSESDQTEVFEAEVESQDSITISEEVPEETADLETIVDTTSEPEYSYEIYLVKGEEGDSVVFFEFTHPKQKTGRKFSFQHFDNFKPAPYEWSYFNDSLRLQDSVKRTILGQMESGKPVFYRFKVGKGNIYYHSLPLTFTNLFLKQRVGYNYAGKVLAHLKPGKIFWDNYHNSGSGNSYSAGKTPLQYILSQPSLAWAWYMTLAGALLYILFYSKRRQRIIPLKYRNTNTSIEFVETLSLMYRKSNFARISEIKARNLRMFIWERYKVSSDLPLDEYAEKVAVFSGIERSKVMLIFVLLKNLNYAYATREEFLEFHQLIKYFHKNCK